MRIEEALAEQKPLDVKFPGGGVLHIVYQQSNATIAEMENLEARRKEEGFLVKLMQDVVKAWDLTRVEKVPYDPETTAAAHEREVPVDINNPEDVRLYVTQPIILGVLRAVRKDQQAEGEA
jgi:hypothetical protein